MANGDIAQNPILIVGAGIGGLTTAHALRKRGLPVRVLEAAKAIREVGAGIQIPPNAMKVLRALDLDTVVSARAFRPVAIEARMGQSGRGVFHIPLAEQAETRWGAPYLHIHRADYIAALSESLPKDILQLDARVMGYSQTENGVSVQLMDGTSVEGSFVIGADGIKSAVREHMLGPDAPEFTGNMAWRALVPTQSLGELAPNPTACAWFGRGRHAVTYRLGAHGELANLVGVVERDDWQEEGWSVPGDQADALKDFGGWHPVITRIIKQADSLHRWALFDRKPLARWVDGRVALMGDAAHPMLPFLAQGAAMAVEDAWTLAEVIGEGRELSDYQTRRLPRSSKIQAASRANMGLFHKRSRAAQLTTYGPMWMAGKVIPNLVHRRMDWLYGFDAVGERHPQT